MNISCTEKYRPSNRDEIGQVEAGNAPAKFMRNALMLVKLKRIVVPSYALAFFPVYVLSKTKVITVKIAGVKRSNAYLYMKETFDRNSKIATKIKTGTIAKLIS